MNELHQQLKVLERLREEGMRLPFQFAEEADRAEGVAIGRLLRDPALLHELMHKVAQQMQSDNLVAAASLFQKRLASVLLASVLTPLSTVGLGLIVDADTTEIVLVDNMPASVILGGKQQLLLVNRLPQDVQNLGGHVHDDLAAVQHVLKAVFDNTLGPLIYQIASEFNLSPKVMWGNVGNFVGYLYGELCEHAIYKHGAAADKELVFNSVGFTAPPLAETFREEWFEEITPARKIRVRNSCCLWNQFPGNKSCTTCPLVCSAERAELLTAYHA
ncbi:ferric iron reductase protein FhuF [Tumebacillus sp. BK434]|uniref:IucA/IucC family C-terminal-domain containing protein n=1 Tax=Tumebacillus sp. BK434 TaxID=2512169 RepID=UPI00105364ED|nr:IucA/IucC family C-terminal-domain containing protein [Tumebacillus sp. BK434]TCP55753.1 ferric iron reductase protein FhuF [Tumebacillus sp. BK434]